MRLFARTALLAIAVVCQPTWADEQQERDAVRDAVTKAWTAGDYETLERLHTQYSDFLHERTSSGASKMGILTDVFFYEGQADSDAEFKRNIARTERWAQLHPNSPFAYVVHALALMSFASHARGGGYADTVTPQGWADFHKYNQRAIKYLVEHQAVASRTTSWHATMIILGERESRPHEALNRLFEDGIALNPADFRLYQFMEDTLLPKWHGSAQQLDVFIRDVSRRAPAAYGMELYARLYSAAGEAQYEAALYTGSLVEWSLMKVGLQAWVIHFPTLWNKNIFAYHACLAGDKPTTKRLLDEIAGSPEWNIWGSNPPITFNACVRWVADPKAESTSPLSDIPASRGDAATTLDTATSLVA
jgi:hypothetical protein